MEYSVAPSSEAFCVACEKVHKDEWRFDYRKRVSSSLRDQRRIHSACIGGIPLATRAEDLRRLQRWASDPLLSEAAEELLNASVRILQGPAASSGV